MRQLKISKSITNREVAALDKYLSDISKEQLITPEEEVELAQKIKAGDDKALEKLVNANLRFVVSVAKQYQNQGLSLPDLINEGNVGLIKAAKKFDETRGFKFISYAVWWIRQSILQALAEQSRIVRLPLNQVGTISKIKKEYSRLEQNLQRVPSAAEIADSLDIPDNKIDSAFRMNLKTVSVDAPLPNEEGNCLLDVLNNNSSPDPDAILMDESLSLEIQRSLALLNEKEREILMLHFGIGIGYSLTLEEIGTKYGLTRERVRQIKEKALRRLRSNLRCNNLKPFLG
ncbi:MAG: RNA polymerase sigma factor RpoD/SigA [Bacteroidales bacterium]|nr:RNA polymerase sigma factor RpoD/SigA [Bacteroidales bacterium]MDD2204130.1 RNA polymerase sigma factor RpoD/SigA [Bacteroidales bacterium]MDD3913794.1 RNA polymerase sigma factor RpoD/SigA [Bacteroidales bacterium]MDD4633559.1 RNA polymerase sigma factor RpoD/SigA [Bacteroidales bacterium]